MSEKVNINVTALGSTERPEEGKDALRLELNIRDANVIKYLTGFDESQREDKAVEALRVGVIAIQSASPTLDTKIVEDRFREIDRSINTYLTGFRDDLAAQLEEHFKPGSGSVPRSLEDFFGNNGVLTYLFNQYFGTDGGNVSRLLEGQIGPSSEFAKSLDPNNKESVISRIEKVVENQLKDKSAEIIGQFSLDTKGSALSRLKSSMDDEIQKIAESNTRFFSDLKEALGIKTGKEMEAEKGTEKGREFESDLYPLVAEMGRLLGDSTENVRAVVGSVPRSKKGDYVITLGDTSGAPGQKIVVEAKKEQGYKLKDVIEELKEAKENRESAAGIFAFPKGYAPPEVGDFHRIGDDFIVTVDEESIEKHQPLIFLEAAYKIVRALVITTSRKEAVRELDWDRIRRELDSLSELVGRLSELSTKAKTISNSSQFIETTVNQLKTDMELRLNNVLSLLSRVPINPEVKSQDIKSGEADYGSPA